MQALHKVESRLQAQSEGGVARSHLLAAACRAFMVRDGTLLDTDSISELGIFGYLVRRGDMVIENKTSGHMIRTKVSCIRIKLQEVTYT